MKFSPKLIAEQVANKKGRLHDYIFKRDVETSILSSYATLVRQEYARTGKVPHGSIQILNCVELEQVDKYECCGPDGCIALRTKYEIPVMIEMKSPTPFEYVGSIDLANPFTHVSYGRVGFLDNARFKSKQTKLSILYTFKNNRIYILNQPSLEFISVSGVFADPENLNNCCKDCGGSCYDKDGDFIIPAHFIEGIKSFIYKEFNVVLEQQAPEHQVNLNT